MSSQPDPWKVYKEYAHNLPLRFPVWFTQSRALLPFKFGDALWLVAFAPNWCKPSLISTTGSLVLSIATNESDQAMWGTLVEGGSTFYSLQGFH